MTQQNRKGLSGELIAQSKELHELQLAHEEVKMMLEKSRAERNEERDKREKVENELASLQGDKRLLEEMLGHIIVKNEKKWHRAKTRGKEKLAKAYALPIDTIREYVEEDTAHMYERRYAERKIRFEKAMKGIL